MGGLWSLSVSLLHFLLLFLGVVLYIGGKEEDPVLVTVFIVAVTILTLISATYLVISLIFVSVEIFEATAWTLQLLFYGGIIAITLVLRQGMLKAKMETQQTQSQDPEGGVSVEGPNTSYIDSIYSVPSRAEKIATETGYAILNFIVTSFKGSPEPGGIHKANSNSSFNSD